MVTRKSYIKSIIAIPRVGHYGEIFRDRPRYSSLSSVGPIQSTSNRLFPVLPSQSCNNIYVAVPWYTYVNQLYLENCHSPFPNTLMDELLRVQPNLLADFSEWYARALSGIVEE